MRRGDSGIEITRSTMGVDPPQTCVEDATASVKGVASSTASGGVSGDPDYHDALSKSLLFFQGQRSGKLPPDQSLTWRANSGLTDGSAENVGFGLRQSPLHCTDVVILITSSFSAN
ncbi:hypothetical protein B296_00009077 [Ensete ventricosum]|uniref:cellulase n=1 Tax=Ensete ventricosum TaxID=4639 RepID=A0A427B1H8_ENSVE|nr:hypothetical protein B296_00009077 [Ensete ventricosum]